MGARLAVTLSPDERRLADRLAREQGVPLTRIVAAGLFALAEMPISEATLTLALSVEREPVRRESSEDGEMYERSWAEMARQRREQIRKGKDKG
jgi:hypothetical protein